MDSMPVAARNKQASANFTVEGDARGKGEASAPTFKLLVKGRNRGSIM